MARKRHKPMSPEQIAEHAAQERAKRREADRRAEYGVNTDALPLAANDDVTVIRDKRNGKVQTAHRDDVFDRLIKSPAVMRAIRRLEEEISEFYGEAHREGQQVHVDSSQFPPGQNFNQGRVEAGKRLAVLRTKIGARCWMLLHDLIRRSEIGFPANDGLSEGEAHRQRMERNESNPFDWRRVVQHLTAEVNELAQAGRVRAACDDLLEAYADIDRQAKPRRATPDVAVEDIFRHHPLTA